MNARLHILWLPILLLVCSCAIGCAPGITSGYGKRTGTGRQGINGLSVFSGMLEAAGHEVTSVTRLSSTVREVDCIVWAPDDFGAPSEETFDYLDSWVRAPGRRMIFIGRDYDAIPWYCRKVAPLTESEEEQANYQALARESRAGLEMMRRLSPKTDECPWFRYLRSTSHRQVTALEGDSPLLQGVDADNVDMELYGQWDPPDDARILLRCEDEPLVFAVDVPTRVDPWLFDFEPGEDYDEVHFNAANPAAARVERGQFAQGGNPFLTADEREETGLPPGDAGGDVAAGEEGGESATNPVFIVANGSFLFNAPLVHHEHRKLAANLIEQIGPEPLRIAVLETPTTDVPIGDSGPESSTLYDFLDVFPLNWILLHWLLVGILACFMVFPIFGRPREPDIQRRTDFRMHVDALARFLKRSGNVRFAEQCIAQWEARSAPQYSVRDSTGGHSPASPPGARQTPVGEPHTPQQDG